MVKLVKLRDCNLHATARVRDGVHPLDTSWVPHERATDSRMAHARWV
jgi:hypothetical protein